MKNLNDFEKDLNKCSKCGHCQLSCPVFKISKNECAVSKGKFIMLHAVTRKELKLSENINKYLDMCLKCGKCNDFCPSGIDALQIINCAKHEYMKQTFKFKLIKFIQSKFIFNNLINFFNFLSSPFRLNLKTNKASSIVYFKGCINNVFPLTDNYLKKIVKDIEIIEPKFDCCGLPFLSEGNIERFEQAAKENLQLIPEGTKYIVTDCASCESTLKFYNKYFEKDVFQGVEFLNWGDLIARKNIRFKFKKPLKVTFHKPCHLGNDKFLTEILQNCENVEYIKMNDYDECCGFAGTFGFRNPKLSKKIIQNKINNTLNTDADYVITTCPSCLVGLKFGLKMSNKKHKIKAVSLLEFLNYAEIEL